MLGRTLTSISKRSTVLRSSVTQRTFSALASHDAFSPQQRIASSQKIRPVVNVQFSSAALSTSDEEPVQVDAAEELFDAPINVDGRAAHGGGGFGDESASKCGLQCAGSSGGVAPMLDEGTFPISDGGLSHACPKDLQER